MRVCYMVHYSDIILSAMASQTTGVSIVYPNVCSGACQRKHQSSASLAFVRGIHRSLVNSPHKGPVTRKMLPFHDVIMCFKTHALRAPGSTEPMGPLLLIENMKNTSMETVSTGVLDKNKEHYLRSKDKAEK